MTDEQLDEIKNLRKTAKDFLKKQEAVLTDLKKQQNRLKVELKSASLRRC